MVNAVFYDSANFMKTFLMFVLPLCWLNLHEDSTTGMKTKWMYHYIHTTKMVYFVLSVFLVVKKKLQVTRNFVRCCICYLLVLHRSCTIFAQVKTPTISSKFVQATHFQINCNYIKLVETKELFIKLLTLFEGSLPISSDLMPVFNPNCNYFRLSASLQAKMHSY